MITTYGINEIKAFKYEYENGETNNINLLPKNYLVLTKEYEHYFEHAIFYISDEKAKHYIGPIFNVGNSIPGTLIYSIAKSVWKMNFELIYKESNSQISTIDNNGSKYITSLIFKENSIMTMGTEYH